ncbi:MAG: protein translocase subunit SecF, partial [Proteobacteria bacterium]|nr:protein translocase subunit SecF [Pseudomonadota bacterium]
KDALGTGLDYRRTETVGPKVGGELIEAGIVAVLLALSAMLLYIWFRFEWQFGVGAVVALTHDVILTIGIFALLGLEFNLSTVAAILTIAGYSINDTVVVYDRVRENLRKYKTMDLDALLNLSINNTLSRTLLTSVTTLLALFALFLFGGEVIKGFSFAMIWGVIVGTYSSIWIAVPLLVYMKLQRGGLIVGETEETP